MSNVYSLEPPTKGKVRESSVVGVDARQQPSPLAASLGRLSSSTFCSPPPRLNPGRPSLFTHPCPPPRPPQVLLHTTHGTLDIELWPKEAPLACRNFVQLALEGAYDGLPFHRILPGVAIQGGATGGASIYGSPFKDEFHSRLRFNHRGLVAAAGGGGGVTAVNGPQFFVTLAPSPHLDRKHTIFGKLAGDSVYAAATIGEVEVGADDAPAPPAPAVTHAEVVWNPFDDLVPRTTPAAAAAAREAAAKAAAATATAAARPAATRRDAKLLSFGDEEEEEEEGEGGFGVPAATAGAPAAPSAGIVSAHDALGGADGRLAAPDVSAAAAAAEAAADEEERAAVRARLAARAAAAAGARAKEAKGAGPAPAAAAPAPAPAPAPPPPAPPITTDDRRAAALEKASRPAAAPRARPEKVRDAELLTSWQRKHAAYAARQASGGAAAEEAAVARLQAFQARLRAAKGAGGGGGEAAGGVAPAAAAADGGPLPGRADAYRAGDVDLAALAGHALTGPTGARGGGGGGFHDPLARDMEEDDGLETVDPLAGGGGGGKRRRGGGSERR